MMTRLFKVCFALTIFITFYFFGYVGAALIHGLLRTPEEPVEEVAGLETLAELYSQRHPYATPWETCEQEVN
jgi:hypothetical protein